MVSILLRETMRNSYDNTKYLQAVRRAGMRVLYNEKVELEGLQIIGVDYRDTRKEEAFRSILKKDRGSIDRSQAFC